MCGIVGYIGPRNAIDVVMEGLGRLEYRGYDSAGICMSDPQDGLKIYKETGTINVLKEAIRGKKLYSNIGIGHTRWATHGKVVNENAHPHGNAEVAIVHNGIIENAVALREMLIAGGATFSSDTDSEVFFILVCRFLEKGLRLHRAVSESFKLVEGNSAFVVIDRNGNEIVAVKRSTPLVCGESHSATEAFVSSDPYALVGYADHLYFPDDGVVCVLSCDGTHAVQHDKIRFYELDGSLSDRVAVQQQQMRYDECDKGAHEHYMLKEIHEQPHLIRNWLHYYLEAGAVGAEKLALFAARRNRPNRIHIIGCGTAWHAGLVIKNFIEKYDRIPVNVELASEFRYREPLIFPGDMALFISQSGETADTIAAEDLCRRQGVETVSIVNVEGSTLYRNCKENLLIRAGMEIGVASTKAFTLQVLTGYLFARAMGIRQGEVLVFDLLKGEISKLAQKMEELLERAGEIQAVAAKLYTKKGFIFTGRGRYYPIALEGALKLKEIAYVHAEGYAAGELKHGPIAMIDEEMVNVAIVGPELYEKTVSNMQEVRARRGIILAIAPASARELLGEDDYFIPLDFSDSSDLNPIYVNIVTQLFAYYMAKFKGTDIDKPRNLAKSVTVE